MRFLVVTANFPPEPLVAGQVSRDIAKGLVARGHKAMVITSFPSRPGGRLLDGYSRRLFRYETDGSGLTILRCFSFLSKRSTIGSRMLENLSFALTAGAAVLAAERPDGIYGDVWPLFATWALWMVCFIRKIPLVVSVQDAFPETLVVQGRVSAKNPVVGISRWLDGVIARRCAAQIAISENLATLLRDVRRVRPERVAIIPLWIGSEEIVPDDKRAVELRAMHNIPADAFLLAYVGSIGAAACVETVIQSLKYLAELSSLYLLIAGDGANLGNCRQLAMQISPERVRFHTPLSMSEASIALAAADALVLPTKGRQSLASMPSKLISYFLSARPVIAMAVQESDLAKIIADSNLGWVIPPDEPVLLAELIRQIAAVDAVEVRRRGRAGRDYALRALTREPCLPRVCELLEKVASGASPVHSPVAVN